MQTVNEQLADEAISHSIDLTRYSNSVIRRMVALLNRTDADLFSRLSAALESMPPDAFTVERLDSLWQSVHQINSQAFNAIRNELEGELRDLVAYEADYQQQLFASTLPVELSVATVAVDHVYSSWGCGRTKGCFKMAPLQQ